jgi:hypothetical protein
VERDRASLSIGLPWHGKFVRRWTGGRMSHRDACPVDPSDGQSKSCLLSCSLLLLVDVSKPQMVHKTFRKEGGPLYGQSSMTESHIFFVRVRKEGTAWDSRGKEAERVTLGLRDELGKRYRSREPLLVPTLGPIRRNYVPSSTMPGRPTNIFLLGTGSEPGTVWQRRWRGSDRGSDQGERRACVGAAVTAIGCVAATFLAPQP